MRMSKFGHYFELILLNYIPPSWNIQDGGFSNAGIAGDFWYWIQNANTSVWAKFQLVPNFVRVVCLFSPGLY